MNPLIMGVLIVLALGKQLAQMSLRKFFLWCIPSAGSRAATPKIRPEETDEGIADEAEVKLTRSCRGLPCEFQVDILIT